LGYSKRSGQGLDYDLGLVYMDGETAVGLSLRGDIGDAGGLGWFLGASTDGDLHTQSVGLGYKF